MSRRHDAVVVGFGLTLGAILGLAWPARPPPQPAPPVVRSSAPVQRHVVCRTQPAPAVNGCDQMALRAAWCQGRLRAETRARPTSAPPEAVGVDDPGPWKARVAQILADCHLDATPLNTDCAEYPCVTALRLPPGDANHLEGLVDACGAASGLDGQETSVIMPLPIDCGDGTFQTMWMFGVLDLTTFNALYPSAKDAFLFSNEEVLLGARRAEALARGWTCEGKGT